MEGDFISKLFGFCNRIYIHDEIQQHLPLGLVVRQQMTFWLFFHVSSFTISDSYTITSYETNQIIPKKRELN